MLKKLGLFGLVPLSIASCGWEPEYDAEYSEVSDGIYKEYSDEIKAMLNNVDDNSLVNILVTERGVDASANHAFVSDYGLEHYIHGTGFILHEDAANYYVATNYHVISAYLERESLRQIVVSKANKTDFLSGANVYNNSVPYDQDSDRAIVYGDQVLFDGEDVYWGFPNEQGHHNLSTPPNRKIDLSILAIPKSSGDFGFDDGYSPIPLADPFNFDFNDGDLYITDQTWEGYTIGFPAGYKRMNSGTTGALQIISGDGVIDQENESRGEVSDKWYWQQNWYYKFYQAGGSSGSPILNENGELITVLASGYNWNGTEWTGGVSLSEVNAAVCNAAELVALKSIGTCVVE